MPTTETAEREAKKDLGDLDGGFFRSLNRILSKRIPIKIISAGDIEGDIQFSVNYRLDLGITLQDLSHQIYKKHSFADFFGELLILLNWDVFVKLAEKKNYDSLARAYRHKQFGFMTKGDNLLFQFHIELIHRLLNEFISKEISDDVAKTPAATQIKVRRCEEHENITEYVTQNNNLRLIVTKTDLLKFQLEKSMETILAHYGVKGKDVSITNNMFSFQVDVSDKGEDK
ncbi:MAG: hypothetical protein KKB30_17130 [Proteobacteria bacterium]|nr:hypothetical protein [Pseudomonadota bacterium]MBU1739887.1 hypothetical protein [Pseudomonadota bacterium]MBU1858217.1 hypothetical protein [Verrucomicrobiota bacterium]